MAAPMFTLKGKGSLLGGDVAHDGALPQEPLAGCTAYLTFNGKGFLGVNEQMSSVEPVEVDFDENGWLNGPEGVGLLAADPSLRLSQRPTWKLVVKGRFNGAERTFHSFEFAAGNPGEVIPLDAVARLASARQGSTLVGKQGPRSRLVEVEGGLWQWQDEYGRLWGDPLEFPLVVPANTPQTHADYYADITTGDFRVLGEAASPATFLSHDTPDDPGYVEVCPAFVNQIGPFTGGGVGVVTAVGGTQFLPRNNTAPGGERWTSVNTAVDKYVRYLNSHELEISMTAPKGGTGNAAGLKTPLLAATNAGEQEASFYLDMSGVNTEKLFFYLAWESASTTRYFFMPAVWQADSQGRGRIVMTLPASALASDRLMFMVSNPYHSDIEARILLKGISVTPAVSRLLRDSNPVVIGAQPARTAILNVPNGDYDLFAWTDRGITSAVATASAGSGIDLRQAFGSCRIYKVAAWAAGRYVTGSVDDDPSYTTVYETDSSALLQIREVTAPDANIAAQTPNQPWSLQTSSTYRHRSRIEVRPGDRFQVDPVLYKRRNEVTCVTPMPFDTDVWMSYPFAILGGIHLTTPGATHETADVACIWQWRYTDMVGDTVGLSPEFNLSIQGDNKITVSTMSTTVQNPPDGSPPYALRWSGLYVPNQWHRFVARMQFNPDGGGMLGIWWDGEEVYEYQETPIGHHKTLGPQAHWGYYGVQSGDVIAMERGRVEFGTTDLSSRILRPYPI